MAAPPRFNLRALGGQIAGLAWVGLGSFVGTLLAATLGGAILAAGSYYFLGGLDWRWRALAAVLALAEGVIAGAVLGTKRALVAAIAYALTSLRLGGALIRLLCERMLGFSQQGELGAVASRVSAGLARLPLAQAEELLRGAVEEVGGEASQDGWFKRRIRARLLELVQAFTVARFRKEEAGHGGIDLLTLKQELENSVDHALAERVQGGARLATLLVVVGLPWAAVLQTWLVHYIATHAWR